MLTTLRSIIQEVNSSKDPASALHLAVRRIQESMQTAACSLFLTDQEKGEHVLMATSGLDPALIKNLRLKMNQGLVGLVSEREEPINLENAPAHPNYEPLLKNGEEKFLAFLGVPITYQRRVLGVLVVQQHESRRFDEEEESFLITLSAQLGGAIAYGQATKTLAQNHTAPTTRKKSVTLNGVPSAAGVGIGQAVVIYPLAELHSVPDKQCADIDNEIELLHDALKRTRQDIQRLSASLQESLPEDEHGIFDAYLKILESTSLISEIESRIKLNNWAPGALRTVVIKRVQQFEAMDDAYLKERATDLRDLGQRVLANLQASERKIPIFPEKTILVSEEVTAAMLGEVTEGRLKGIVSFKGSTNAHSAILARAMGIPAVMGISGASLDELDNKELIVDGYYGQVYLHPSSTVVAEFKTLLVEEDELNTEFEALRKLPAQTTDGYRTNLYVNTGLAADLSRSLTVGAEGVGLYRTEVPFMMRDRFPSEEEQRILYRQLLNAFAPRDVVMRTLDVGGDKMLPYFPIEETNPNLGWRGIRITLDHPDIFLVQLRAMLRANEGLNNLRILLPMVSGVTEVEAALRLLQQAFDELREEGLDIVLPKIGVMIEVPSAIYQAKKIAQRVDFISVGSNDLTQYILAVDRNNARVANLYDSLHPAVLAALQHVITASHSEGKSVSLCGEMAGDPVAAILLLAMRYDTLSMSAIRLPRIKWVLRKFSLEKAQQLLQEVIGMDDPVEIRVHMEQALEEAGAGGLIRAGK